MSIKELWGRVQAEWEAISEQECQKLVSGMPDRIRGVFQANRGYTKYWDNGLYQQFVPVTKLFPEGVPKERSISQPNFICFTYIIHR